MRNFIITIMLLVSSCLHAQDVPTFEQAWQSAQSGDSNGYYWLGLLYYQGEGTEKNYKESLKWFLKAANAGDTDSYAWIAHIYNYGNGCEQNYEEAFKWYKKAALCEYTVAYGWLATLYYEGKGCKQNYVEALKWFKKAASVGTTSSYCYLGELYSEGKGTPRDVNKAFYYYKKAAESGDPAGYAALGYLFYGGVGTEQDFAEAFKWAKKAADNQDPNACDLVATMYSFGLGIGKNDIEAFKYAKFAADNGTTNSYFKVGLMYYRGQGVAQNIEEAYNWMKKSAESGDPAAYGSLGSMYLYGNGTLKNPHEAFKWTCKAVENGDIASNIGLGIMYLNGIGTERNEKEAFDCFKKAASIDDPVACSWLGKMYFDGKGTSINEAEGFKWTKKTAEKGYVGSYIVLGICYEKGKGTEKNIDEAIIWYKKAYDKGIPNAPMFLCTAYYTQKDYIEVKNWADLTINQKEYAFVGYRILALLNIYGLGVPQNKDKAFEFMSLALDGARKTNQPMPNTLDAEGELYLADNNISKAREIYNAILKETPDFYAKHDTKLSKFMKEYRGSDVDFDIPMANNISNHTFAVVISNEKYQMEKSVQYAENDGKAFAEYCRKTLGLPEKNVHFIANATLNNIKHEIKWMQDVIAVYKGDAKVIFYYAGHGIPDEQNKSAYLLPVDGYGSDVTTGYSLENLYKTLGSLPSKSVTVFLDACFSGAKRDGDMLASARGVAIKVKQSNPSGNMVVFTAAQGDETAYPYKEEGHGLFTYYLLKKLQETKGDVTLGELGEYIKTQVERQSIVVNGKLQSPAILPASTIGNDWKEWKLNK